MATDQDQPGGASESGFRAGSVLASVSAVVTVDYRLNRVRQLVGIDPGSTRGVRILTATVTRALARRDA